MKTATSISNRSIVYIDGLNLYYGAIRGGPYKWLNIQEYFERLRQHDDIQSIYYFTARISGPHRERQTAYLQALATLPLVEVRLGKFKNKEVSCRVSSCKHSGSRKFKAQEEKRTDVAIGVQMLEDAYDDSCDRFVIVSGDSDLLPAVDAIKQRYPQKQILVYVPSRHKIRGAAVELRSAADKDRTLPQGILHAGQFPSDLDDGRGGVISKPDSW